jgi:transmembrane secretion effector
LCSRARLTHDLDDEYFCRLAIIAIVDVDHGVAAFLFVYTVSRGPRRQGRPPEAGMHWLRARFSSDSVTLSANLLLVLVYVLMALVRKTEVFVVFSALAGVGWTISASELWVAAQRAMPSWARGRMNATVIMISQGAMVLGGVIWGSAGAIAGTSYILLGAAVLFLMSLLLARRLSINVTSNLEETVSALSSGGLPEVAATLLAV